MKQNRRHEYILSSLKTRQFCAITQLASELGVSDETIRRDIKKLDKAGKARRVHGGVTLITDASEGPFISRLEEGADAKRKIVQAYARSIREGSRIFLDGGTTNCFLARELAYARGLTVVTNSLEIAHILGRHKGIRLIIAPGEVDHDDNAVYGPEAVSFIRNFQLDTAVFTAAAIDLSQGGIYDIRPEEAHLKRDVGALATDLVVLADASKFGKRGFVRFCNVIDTSMIVTDASLSKNQRALVPADVLTIVDTE
ncbi:DeoR family transcriptional regulator [Stappia sp. GBMRC 2046]|uniref:DeoR family transcriptional regulator n=1 Tax=Stappia sediminis TaxID=2692190 RepID=A0A7X3S8A9_9HYPH|nr:DeoR/GlpR family DNA-binding transcription regulator [Stappia sediminis]MXN65594.1 DeoR family transcriptional regulator [Stappia sediminis]